MRPDGIERLRLPLSGWTFEVRPDGWWRELSDDQAEDEAAGFFTPGPDEWVSPSPTFGYTGRCYGYPDPNEDVPSWWLLYGSDTVEVRVTPADGQQPPVRHFGPLWLCEWMSVSGTAEVTLPDGVSTAFDRIPSYIRHAHGVDE